MKLDTTIGCQRHRENMSYSEWWRDFLKGKHPWDVPSKPPLSVIDLFCGAGGFGLGTALAARCFEHRALFSAIADTDTLAMDVYSQSLPVRKKISDSLATIVDYSVEKLDSVAEFDYPPEIMQRDLSAEIGKVDLLIAGPPCQGHSNLNNHTRRNDPRNDLLVNTVAVAISLQARAVVIENVPTAVQAHGNVVHLARSLLASEGYAVADRVLRMDTLGGWQTRARYFMVAVRNTEQQVLDAALNSLLGDKSSGYFFPRDPLNVLWAISDLEGCEGSSVFDTPPVQGPENRQRIDYLFDKNIYDLPNSKRPDCHKNGTAYSSVYGRMHPDRPAPTITTSTSTPGCGRFIHPTRRRLITPHETARIQCFPDNYTFIDQQREPSRTALKKWLGNAVPPYLGMIAVCVALSVLLNKSPQLPWAS